VPIQGERTAKLEARVEALEADVSAVMRELGGTANGHANHKNVRARLHSLENGQEALRIVQEVAEEIRAQHRQAEEDRKRDRRATWKWTVTTIFAGIGVFMTVLALVVTIWPQ
jgi:ElaB/YqjD/DUF883 family membrane-anchored ribosome-binding protein